LSIDSDVSAPLDFATQTYGYYASLLEGACTGQDDPEPNLGGHLVWAGELDATGRALVVAGNIAGAVTLTATHDGNAQRKAVRDGIADFFVTSLDEALRILKNQVRKRETVAVCVGLPVDAVEREMAERGVRPDVHRDDVLHGARHHAERPDETAPAKALIVWTVDAAPARWLPKVDAIALDCLDANERIGRRWLRLGGRYLGRMGAHMVWSTHAFSARLIERIREQAERGEINVRVQIEVQGNGTRETHLLGPMQSNA
jgi:urocanase-like protein